MDAIRYLEQQHRQVEELFEKFEQAGEGARKTRQRLCEQIADQLAIHAEIEEKIFYPATKDDRTEDLLLEAVEEHLAAKRIIADLVEQEPEDELLQAKMKVLQEQVEHHVEEEEQQLFPKVRQRLDKERLEELGEQLEQLATELEERGDARREVPGQTDSPAQL